MGHRPVLNPKLYWLGCAILLVGVCVPELADAQILDRVGQTYQSTSRTWEASLTGLAKSLFLKLALIEILWSGIWWVVERDDPNQVFVSMLRKIMPLMFFWAILLNFDTWIPAVIDSFAKAGQQAANTGPLTPSSVLDRGLEIATTITTAANEIGLFSGAEGVGKYILCGLSALGILLCFGVIAGQMLVTLIESYIVVSGGVIFLGFAGSRWTTTFAEKYISYGVSVGVKLFVTYLIIGAGQHLSDDWAAKVTSEMVVGDYLEILAGALVYMFLAWQIPSLASSMLTGAVSMTLGSAAATVGTMAAGAAGAAGLAQAGLASAGNSVAGAVQAGNAAINQASASGESGLWKMAGGAAGALTSATAGAVGDTIRGLGEGSAGGNLANRMNERTASIVEAAAAGAPAASVPGSEPSAPSTPEIGSNLAAPAAGPAASSGTGAAPTAPAASSGSGSPAASGGSGAPAAASSDTATRATPAAPQSSIIDTSGNISQALADRDSGAASSLPAPAAEPAAASGDSTAPTSDAAAAPAGQAAAPNAAAGAAPKAPKEEPEKNALQQLADNVSALGAMPNDSAAGAGVQINLTHNNN